MGEAVDRLTLKLARVWVPPHTKVTRGKTIKVKGYWRDDEKERNPMKDWFDTKGDEHFPKPDLMELLMDMQRRHAGSKRVKVGV